MQCLWETSHVIPLHAHLSMKRVEPCYVMLSDLHMQIRAWREWNHTIWCLLTSTCTFEHEESGATLHDVFWSAFCLLTSTCTFEHEESGATLHDVFWSAFCLLTSTCTFEHEESGATLHDVFWSAFCLLTRSNMHIWARREWSHATRCLLICLLFSDMLKHAHLSIDMQRDVFWPAFYLLTCTFEHKESRATLGDAFWPLHAHMSMKRAEPKWQAQIS